MSIAEMKERKDKVIATIHTLSDEKLMAIEEFINDINQESDKNSIDFIYKKAVAQYHETLQKLAQ